MSSTIVKACVHHNLGACSIKSVLTSVLKPLYIHSSQNGNHKLAASAYKYCDWMKVLAASSRG